jgi:hypothetical protein
VASKNDKTEQVNFEVRRDLGNALAFISGQQALSSFAAVTPEELLDQQIERIQGKDSPSRPNELHRLEALENNLLRSVERIRSLPPEAFRDPDSNTDVNSPIDGA